MPSKGSKQSMADRLERFIAPEPNTGCWLWTGGCELRGHPFKQYGRIWVDGRTLPAHRVCWEHYNGPVPAGMFVCHKCDMPLCVNPEHLFLGTPKDNTQDMMAKGRDSAVRHSRRGTNSNWNKLTPAQVLAIRADHRYQWVIASDYRISQTAVSQIKLRKRWKHL